MSLDEAIQYQLASTMPAHQCSTETLVMPPTMTNNKGHATLFTVRPSRQLLQI